MIYWLFYAYAEHILYIIKFHESCNIWRAFVCGGDTHIHTISTRMVVMDEINIKYKFFVEITSEGREICIRICCVIHAMFEPHHTQHLRLVEKFTKKDYFGAFFLNLGTI